MASKTVKSGGDTEMQGRLENGEKSNENRDCGGGGADLTNSQAGCKISSNLTKQSKVHEPAAHTTPCSVQNDLMEVLSYKSPNDVTKSMDGDTTGCGGMSPDGIPTEPSSVRRKIGNPINVYLPSDADIVCNVTENVESKVGACGESVRELSSDQGPSVVNGTNCVTGSCNSDMEKSKSGRKEFRLRGKRHVFTVVPVESSGTIIEEPRTPEPDSNVVKSCERLSADTDPLMTPPEQVVIPGISSYNTVQPARTFMTPPCAPYNPYMTVTAAGLAPKTYNPYHTITGLYPSSYQRSEFGQRRVSTVSRREYGVGRGSRSPSLVSVVHPTQDISNSPIASKGSLKLGTVAHQTGDSNIPCIINTPPYFTSNILQPQSAAASAAFPLSCSSHNSAPSVVAPDQATIHSLNQMTVRSAGGVSVGFGSTDGRNMTVRGAVVSPEQLPLLPDTVRSGLEGEGGVEADEMEARQTWGNKVQFVLSCIGYAVGLGNLWRFPYLCYKSGGGAFLIPYFVMLFLCGIPALLMELAVGQYTRRGPIEALAKICPLFKGAGVGTVVISFLLCTYYNVIIAWAIYYFVQSFHSELPWTNCNATWAVNCFDDYGPNVTAPNGSRSGPEEFFNEAVLQKSSGITEMGSMRLELLLALLAAWILVYFSLWKSIRSSGRVVYVTATAPYLMIGAFLWRALTLPGATKGLQYFFEPRWELLGQAHVWVNAAAQNFNSIGIAFGSLIAFSSYNKFNNNIVVDTWAVSLTNCFTSLLSGTIVFSTLGNIAYETGKDIDDVVSEGPGLVFMVYPQALAKMPYANLWAVLFFTMLLVLGLDSQFATVEVIITSLQDAFPKKIQKYLKRHEVLVLIVCFVSFLLGLPNIMQGGIYFFQLIDHYAAAVSLMYLAFFEVAAIVWIYGANRLARNVKEMTGKLPSIYFRFCWYISAPLLILAIWMFSMVDYKEPTYNKGEYIYPPGAIGLGWIIASLSIAPIPIFAVIAVVNAKGTTFWEKLKNSVQSTIEVCPCCGHALDSLDVSHTHAKGNKDQVKLVMYSPQPNTDDNNTITNDKSENRYE